jgi:chromate transporter
LLFAALAFAGIAIVQLPLLLVLLVLAPLSIGALASAGATFTPPCALYFVAYRLWDRFRDAPWQKLARAGLAPLTAGLVIAGGTVMARTADIGWPAVGVTGAAAILLLFTRLNPLWVLGGAGICGALGIL